MMQKIKAMKLYLCSLFLTMTKDKQPSFVGTIFCMVQIISIYSSRKSAPLTFQVCFGQNDLALKPLDLFKYT